MLDPSYPYGEGVALQLRSAVSHLNEVWAVETAGRILDELSPELGWEFTPEAARWLYDETRHMLMGKRAPRGMGLSSPSQIPLGGYIYEAWQHEDPLYGLGMLGYFETKNIGRKRERAAAFHEMGDATSETDMEFDWADETLHAEYGRRWLRRAAGGAGRGPRVVAGGARALRAARPGAHRARDARGSGADPRLRRRAGETADAGNGQCPALLRLAGSSSTRSASGRGSRS